MVAIRQVECPANRISVKCPYEMKATKIVIHNTGNDAPAKDEIAYMHRNADTVSFHFAVDDKEIIQGIDLDRNAFHAGDGNDKGNREGIAIEICYSYCKKKVNGKWVADEEKWNAQYKSKFEAAQKNAAELTAKLLKERGWGIDKVTKHQDYSGKYCPHRTLDNYGWDYFLNLVKGFMTEKPKEEAPKSEAPKATEITKGCKVKVNTGAKSYEGKSVAAFVYNNEYTVDELKGDRAVLGKTSICTAFNVKDLTIVKASGTKTTATKTETTKPTTKTVEKGSKVKVKKGAKSYEGKSVAAFIYNNVYTVDQLKGDRAVLDKSGICTAFNVKDLTVQ